MWNNGTIERTFDTIEDARQALSEFADPCRCPSHDRAPGPLRISDSLGAGVGMAEACARPRRRPDDTFLPVSCLRAGRVTAAVVMQ